MSDKPKTKRLLFFEHLKDHGVPLSRRQIDRLEVQNKFPKRVPLGERKVAWVIDEVDDWVAQKIAARHTEVGVLGAGLKINNPGRGQRGRFKPRDAGPASS